TGATIDGLRKAWLLACEQGDRQSAETIFNDLLPYNTQQQTQDAILELQDLALSQLEELGVDKDDISEIAAQLSAVSAEEGDKPQIMSITAPHPSAAEVVRELKQLQEERLDYSDLAGFGVVLNKMREFGLSTPDDRQFRGFLAQAQAFHGINGPVLSEAFLFYGPSRDDVALFALATAGEIGRPVVTMDVNIDVMGNGVIKVSGPMRRPAFGPPRRGDLPGQCTLIIQNIDLLQELFHNEEAALASGARFAGDHQRAPHCPSAMPGLPGRSMQAEILGYLGAMFNHGDVFVIATAASSNEQDPLMLGERLLDLLGPLRELEVACPCPIERYEVLSAFSEEHLSLKDLDLRRTAELMEGLSRYDIVAVCQAAVEEAYRQSLRQSRHQMVTWPVVLRELLHYLDPQSETYQKVEDMIVEQFRLELPDSL
ncbi:MAG: hypothetical protein LBP28_06590, partial [Coriobacteriales bacterium]|nr:hypothetical protein [Coriobacteriales bacterium]